MITFSVCEVEGGWASVKWLHEENFGSKCVLNIAIWPTEKQAKKCVGFWKKAG